MLRIKQSPKKNKNDNEKIMELLGINENTLFYLELDIRRSVYQIAIDFGLYKEYDA